MRRTVAPRFAATLVSVAAVAFACLAFAQRGLGTEAAASKAEAAAAGVDRVVMLGGKTYLAGKSGFPDKEGDSATVAWSKASGPGEVTFADAAAPATTATFSAVGDYVLKLTATKGSSSKSST